MLITGNYEGYKEASEARGRGLTGQHNYKQTNTKRAGKGAATLTQIIQYVLNYKGYKIIGQKYI